MESTDCYVAKEDETVAQIAAREGLDVGLLLALNQQSFPGLTRTAKLQACTELEVPISNAERIGYADKRPTATLRLVEIVEGVPLEQHIPLPKPEQGWLSELDQLLHQPHQCDELVEVKELAEHLLEDASLQEHQRWLICI